MRRIFEKWFECEDGHIIVGNDKKSKCDADLWQKNYIKGKRKGQWIEELTKTKACGKKIVAEGIIPEEVDYSVVWDYKIAHAFLVGQRLDSEFLIGFQKEYSKLWSEIGQLKEKVYGKDTGGDPAGTGASKASS
jgi:hypothetical protein